MEFFKTRHSIKGADSLYPGITESGVELAMQRAREDILRMVEQAPDGAVVFIGGATDQVRTKSTAEVYGNELAEIAEDKSYNMKVIKREEIYQMTESGKGYSEIVSEISRSISEYPDKKIVVDFPLAMKEFAFSSKWFNADGKPNAYFWDILDKNDFDDFAAMKEWIGGAGKSGDLVGPNPTEVAKEILAGFKRLQAFAEKHIPNRPLIIGSVGHAFNLDVLAIYLANNGKVDLEGLNKLGDSMTKETEMARIKIEDGGVQLLYRGQEFDIDKNIL